MQTQIRFDLNLTIINFNSQNSKGIKKNENNLQPSTERSKKHYG